MTTTLGFLHTSPVHVATFDALVATRSPGTPTEHLVDEPLLARARVDGLTAEVVDATHARVAELASRGAAVVVVTCSTIGGVAESTSSDMSRSESSARPPVVIRVDRPMARAAVTVGSRIGVVAALESTLGPTEQLLREEADRASRSSLQVITSLVAQAWSSFERGDIDGFLDQVAAAAAALAPTVDVVVLAQASMAAAVGRVTDLRTPVLSSPTAAVDAALEALREVSPTEALTTAPPPAHIAQVVR